MRFIGIVAVLALATAPALAQKFTDETDRFTGVRSIDYQDAVSLDSASVSSYVKVGAGKEEFFSIISIYSDDSWQYLRCRSTHWLADGQPLKMADAVHDGTAMRGGVVEHLIQRMTKQQMQALAKATTVEFKICNDEYRLSPAQHDGLRKVITTYTGPIS
jgi:hypothetical protein